MSEQYNISYGLLKWAQENSDVDPIQNKTYAEIKNENKYEEPDFSTNVKLTLSLDRYSKMLLNDLIYENLYTSTDYISWIDDIAITENAVAAVNLCIWYDVGDAEGPAIFKVVND